MARFHAWKSNDASWAIVTVFLCRSISTRWIAEKSALTSWIRVAQEAQCIPGMETVVDGMETQVKSGGDYTHTMGMGKANTLDSSAEVSNIRQHNTPHSIWNRPRTETTTLTVVRLAERQRTQLPLPGMKLRPEPAMRM